MSSVVCPHPRHLHHHHHRHPHHSLKDPSTRPQDYHSTSPTRERTPTVHNRPTAAPAPHSHALGLNHHRLETNFTLRQQLDPFLLTYAMLRRQPHTPYTRTYTYTQPPPQSPLSPLGHKHHPHPITIHHQPRKGFWKSQPLRDLPSRPTKSEYRETRLPRHQQQCPARPITRAFRKRATRCTA